jgi:hypothetical protein
MATENNWRRVRHGLFTYWVPTKVMTSGGEEQERFTEQMAFRGQVVNVERPDDLARGEQFGAFEAERFNDDGSPIEAPASATAPDGTSSDDEAVELAELDHEDLVDWLQGTGMFDGEKKPNANEVVQAGHGNPELAQRLLAAENEASGGQPRETVIKGLSNVAAQE